jgi:dolichol-phosphate mannosyltransferase
MIPTDAASTRDKTRDSHLDADRRTRPELVAVIPVYNEQDSIAKVVHEWMSELDKFCGDFVVLTIDDGSRDRSLEVLRSLQDRYGPRLLVLTRPNRGHGQTCLEGYRRGATMGARYLLQIDSDGQCDPRYFKQLWHMREQFAVVYGERKTRDDGWKRVVVSQVLRLMLRLAFHVNCPDANVPYRLMKTDAVMGAVNRISEDFHLANVALAILLAQDKSCSHGFVPIGFRERLGGKPSVKLSLFGRKAVELYRSIRKMLVESETPVK